MAALVNPSNSSSNSSTGRALFDTSGTPPPIHRVATGSGSGHDNETGSDASSPPPNPPSSQHSRDYDPSSQLSESSSYMPSAAAAAAAAAADATADLPTSGVSDGTAQFEADKRTIYK
jgi:hypothetical protein